MSVDHLLGCGGTGDLHSFIISDGEPTDLQQLCDVSQTFLKSCP